MTVRRAPQLQRPLSIFLYGNKPLASQWLPWAKKKLHTLERYHVGFYGKSFGSMIYRPINAVTIMIKAAKDQKWIIIWAEAPPLLYMESGLLDHRNIAPLNEDTYLPSIRHYGTEIDGIRGEYAALGDLAVKEVAPQKLKGENQGEGDSEAVGCKKEDKLKKVTVAGYNFGTRTFEKNKPFYCDPAVMFLRKNIQVKIPPSKFSGKMRLFVQALYGTTRDDYALDPVMEELGPLKIENADLAWTYNNNSGLFSGRNFDYFLLRVSRSGLWARPIVPDEAGQVLRDYLRANPTIPEERKLRYETYLLSTLHVEADSKWVQITEDSGDAYKHGTPLYYGWSWNMDGTEARAVTIQLKEGTLNVWQTTMFRLSIAEADLAETLEDGRLKASFVTEEETQDVTFRVADDHMWYPAELEGGMQKLITQPNAGAAPTHIDSDVPIYAMYDYENDKFDIVRFKRDTVGTGVGVLGGSLANNNDRVAPGCGNHNCGYYSEAFNTAVDIGFYIEQVWDGTGFNTANALVNGNEGSIGSPHTLTYTDFFSMGAKCKADIWRTILRSCGNDLGFCDGTPANNAIFDHSDGYVSDSYGTEVLLQGQLAWESMVVVPIFDCDSVHMGYKRFFDGTVTAGRTTSDAVVVSAARNYNKDGETMEDSLEEGRIEVKWESSSPLNPDIPGGATGIKTHAKDNINEWVSILLQPTKWWHVDMRRVVNGGEEKVFSSRRASNSSVADVMRLPSCMDIGQDDIADGAFSESEAWEEGTSAVLGGYEFDPTLFPTAETMDPVISKTSANHLDYIATAEPENEVYVEKGGYGFENNYIPEDLSTWVGFA